MIQIGYMNTDNVKRKKIKRLLRFGLQILVTEKVKEGREGEGKGK